MLEKEALRFPLQKDPKKYFFFSENSLLNISILIVVIIIMFFRELRLFTAPNFWAELGTYSFSFSFSHNWFSSLFKSYLGYYTFWGNFVIIIAANCFDLKYAPLVNNLGSFPILLIPVIIILWSDADIWKGLWRRVVGVSLVVFAPFTGELWVHNGGNKFYFGLIVFLILLEDSVNITSIRKFLYRILLVVSGLTGTLACFQAPVYVLRALLEKKRECVIQASLLLFCCLVQFYFIIQALREKSNYMSMRFTGFDLISFIQIFSPIVWTRSIVLPLLGTKCANIIGAISVNVYQQNIYLSILWSTLLFMLGCAFFHAITRNMADRQRILVIASYMIIIMLSIISSIGDKFISLQMPKLNNRYFFVPNLILMIIYLNNVQIKKEIKVLLFPAIYTLFLASGLFMGIKNYSLNSEGNNHCFNKDWPKWEDEIEKWNSNSDYIIKIWPPGWFMKLEDRGGRKKVDELIKTVRKGKIKGKIETIEKIVAKLGPQAKEATEALKKEINSGNPFIRIKAAIALGEIGPPARSAVPELVEMAREDNGLYRFYAARALGKIGPEAADSIPVIIDLLKSENLVVQLEALYAIKKIGFQGHSKDAIPAIKHMFELNNYKDVMDKNVHMLVRRHAAALLAMMGPEAKEAIPVLVKALQDEDAMVVWLSADALGQIGADARVALPALRNAMKRQSDPAGLVCIKDAIQKIEGSLRK